MLCKLSKINKFLKKCLQKMAVVLLCGCSKGTEHSRKGANVTPESLNRTPRVADGTPKGWEDTFDTSKTVLR